MEIFTLTTVERAALVRHLTLVRGRLSAANADAALLDGIITKASASPAPVLARMEVFCLLRHVRQQRLALGVDMEQLEERRRSGHDGALDGAWIALDADAAILDGVLRRLWLMT